MKKIILALAILVSISNLLIAQVPSYVPSSGLVGWWPFNGNANDMSSNSNNGIVAGPVLTTDRLNNSNQAFLFDGINDTIKLTIQQNNVTSYSISGWFKTTLGGPILSGRGMPNQLGITLNIHTLATGGPGGVGRALMIADASQTAIGKWTDLTYTDNQWHHIVGVFSGVVGAINSSQFQIYIDGVLAAQSVYTTGFGNAPINNLTNLLIGAHQVWPNTFSGKLDDIGVWNRILTPTEISNLFLANECPDTITTQPTNQIGLKGGSKNFSITHSGTNINYQWQSNSVALGWQNVPNANQYSGVTTNNLSISNLSVSNHNQLFRVVSNKTGCAADTSVIAKLTISNLATDSARLVKLQGDSARLTLDSILYLARINKLAQDSGVFFNHIVKLSNDSVVYVNRIYKLSNDSVFYVNRIVKLSNDSVFMTARINKLKSDSSFYVGRITKLSNDSAFLSGRISKLSYDSIIYVGRIYKLINDSNAFVTRINTLKTDSINNKNTINLLNADITTKGNIITYLQNDTTSKGNTIRSLQLALLNKHDTLYVGSVVSTDTLKISIHTGLSSATPLVNILKVYPNPASSILHIDLEKPGYYTARISSLSGQTTITPTSGSIDISSLASGVYVLTIYDSKDKLVSTNKIMIVR